MVTYQTHDLKLVGSIPTPNIIFYKMINSIGRVSRLQRES